MAPGLGGPGGQVGLGRLELEDDRDEPLGQSVVDVAGQALSLGQAAALALGQGQAQVAEDLGYMTSSSEK